MRVTPLAYSFTLILNDSDLSSVYSSTLFPVALVMFLATSQTWKLDDILFSCLSLSAEISVTICTYIFMFINFFDLLLQAYIEKEDSKKLKQKQRERMQPKMGKMDIDYQVYLKS